MKRKVQVVIIEKATQAPRLLQFRMIPSRGGFWQNITGAVDEGEGWQEAARRELLEESGISLGPLIDLEHHFKFIDQYGEHVEERCYLGFLTGLRLIRLSHEHDQFRLQPLGLIRPDSFGFHSNYEAFLKAKLKAQFS